MRTILTFDRTQTGFTTANFTFDFCTNMFTGVAVSTAGWSLIELGVGMYILDVPNAVAGTVFSVRHTVDTNIFTQGYFTDSISVGSTLDADTIASAVWDSKINDYDDVGGSFGKKMRNIGENVIWSGGITARTANTITLDGTASNINGAYDPAEITIIDDGASVGQCRLILEYDGATRTAVVDRNWKTLPDLTASVIITTASGREHVNEGLARGGTINTITLNVNASDNNNAYMGQVCFIRSGYGEDQARRVIAYDGTTKVATVCDNWFQIPDTTSAYVMLPTGALDYGYIARGVLDRDAVNYNTAGTIGELINNVDVEVSTRLSTANFEDGGGLTAAQAQLLQDTYEEARRARCLASNKVDITREGTQGNYVDTITIYDDDNITELFRIEVYGELAEHRVKLYSKP